MQKNIDYYKAFLRKSIQKTEVKLFLIGLLPVSWAALLLAPFLKKGVIRSLPSLNEALNHPFQITIVRETPKIILLFLFIYSITVLVLLNNGKNYRHQEEHGSAKWGDFQRVDLKYRQNPPSENKILTQNVAVGLNTQIHQRNLNTLVCGGSGAGKTRFYCKPNILQANTSYVIIDPKIYN